MCLIAYSPTGSMITKRVFDYARAMNADGIGIMSKHGVAKFVGRRSGKRAWRYLRRIEGTEYGIHFRWATHGQVSRELAHPFESRMSDTFVMHNGIISRTAALAKRDGVDSDTSIFVDKYMAYVPEPGARKFKQYFEKIERLIGYGNKLLVFHVESEKFTIANEDEGGWTDGVWYSNDYSLPMDMAFEDSYDLKQIYGAGMPDDYSDSMVRDLVQNQADQYEAIDRIAATLEDNDYGIHTEGTRRDASLVTLAKCDDCGVMSLHAARVLGADLRRRCAACNKDMLERSENWVLWASKSVPTYGVAEAVSEYTGESLS